MSPFSHLQPRDTVKTRSGGTVTFLAYVPEAKPAHQVVVFDGTDVLTYWSDGTFALDREPTGLDLVLDTKEKA